jgi:tripeptidyl-peptidase-1
MRATTLLTGLLSLVGTALTAPTVDFSTTELFESLRELPQGWTEVRSASPDTRLTLRIALDQPGQAAFEQKLMEISTPDHPTYGQHLSHAEIKALLKPRDASTSTVLAWLAAAGIKQEDIENDGEWVNFKVAVKTAEEMLDTKFSVYAHEEDKKELVRTLKYSVPKSVAEHINLIQPTTRFSRMLPERSTVFEKVKGGRADKKPHAPEIPVQPLNVTACNATITPACLRSLYNVGDYYPDPAVHSKFAAAGYLEEYAIYDDLETFTEMYAPYAIGANFTVETVNGGLNLQNAPEIDSIEANLDIQYAVAMSYPIPVTYYSTGGRGPLVPDLDQPDPEDVSNEPYLEFFSYILKLPQSELPQTLTTSYGEDEQSVPASYARQVCNMIGQLGARGVSVLFSSGDTGVGSACQTNDGKKTTRFLPIFPAACPWVTSVGGTRGVQPERAVYFSSGGFSDLWPRPAYQDKAVKAYLKGLGSQWKGLYNPNGRGFPDVAAQGYRYHVIDRNGGTEQQDLLIGGTSASAPTFAAIVALLNNARVSAHLPPLGFLNPWLYQVAYKGLNDIVDGGSTGCTGVDAYSGLATPFVPYASWNATTGWDPVTGLGTPDFRKLLQFARPGAIWRSLVDKIGHH